MELLKRNSLAFSKTKLLYRAVDHKLRQRILEEIWSNDNRLDVTSIYLALHLEQSVASQHLAILRKARVVDTVREGKFIYYSVNEARLKELAETSKHLN